MCLLSRPDGVHYTTREHARVYMLGLWRIHFTFFLFPIRTTLSFSLD